jgi:hypothetical protein
MNYIIWNKKDKINGIEAQYFIDDLKIKNTDGVFLIGKDLDNIQAIEIDNIVKSAYDLDDNLTTEEVAQEYIRIKEEAKANSTTKARSIHGEDVASALKEQTQMLLEKLTEIQASINNLINN